MTRTLIMVKVVVAAGVVLAAVACSGTAAHPDRQRQAGSPGSSAEASPSAGTPSRARWAPPPVNATVDYQLGGAYAPARGVTVVTRDREAAPAPGAYGICYVNAFQTQPGERTFWLTTHPDAVLRDKRGKPVEDADWPGEYLLDISTAAKRREIAGVVGGWFDGCTKAGYRAVEPDNLDSWTRSKGRLTRAQTTATATLLIARAHAAGLAIAQKNAAELDGHTLGFDFAVAEECQVYDECGRYTTAYGRHVIEIEYSDTPRRYFDRACRARGATLSVILRDRDVVPRGSKGYVYRSC